MGFHSYSDAWLIQGFWTQCNNESKGGWRSDFTHYSDKPVQCGSSCGVVGAVMTWWCLVVFPGLIAFCIECCSLRIQGPNRLEKGNKEITSFSKAICSFSSVQVKECFPSKQPKRNCIAFSLTQLHLYISHFHVLTLLAWEDKPLYLCSAVYKSTLDDFYCIFPFMMNIIL